MSSFKKDLTWGMGLMIHPIPAANRIKIMLRFLKDFLARSEISSKKPVLLQESALTSTVERLKFPESQVIYGRNKFYVHTHTRTRTHTQTSFIKHFTFRYFNFHFCQCSVCIVTSFFETAFPEPHVNIIRSNPVVTNNREKCE